MMDTFVNGLMRGVDLGNVIADKVKDHKLRAASIGINNAQVTPEIGPDGKPAGFRFGDRVYQQRPTEELLAADRYNQLAQANMVYGDPDKALVIDEAARTQRKSALDDIVKRAFYAGTPEALVGAYAMMDDGVVPLFRRDANGRPQAYTIEDGQEKVLLQADDDKGFVAQARQLLSPELTQQMAELELKRQQQRLEMEKMGADINYTRARTGETGMDTQMKQRGLMGLPSSFGDFQRQDEQTIKLYEQQIEYLQKAAQNDPSVIPILEATMQQYQQVTGLGSSQLNLEGLPPGADIVVRVAQEEGVDPALALSVWMQESSGSTDLGKTGEVIKKGKNAGHYARGPWQIMSFHGEIPQDFEGQTRWAMRHLKEGGDTPEGMLRRYYGSGQAPDGHPTTSQYAQEVMQRAQRYRAPALGSAAKGLAHKDPGKGGLIDTYTDAQAASAEIEQMATDMAVAAGYNSARIPPEVMARFLPEATRLFHSRLQNAATMQPATPQAPPPSVEESRAAAKARMQEITTMLRQGLLK